MWVWAHHGFVLQNFWCSSSWLFTLKEEMKMKSEHFSMVTLTHISHIPFCEFICSFTLNICGSYYELHLLSFTRKFSCFKPTQTPVRGFEAMQVVDICLETMICEHLTKVKEIEGFTDVSKHYSNPFFIIWTAPKLVK